MTEKTATCPVCDSTNTTVLEETNMILDYVCDECAHRWEEYK